MDDIKILAKMENETETFIQTIRIYNQCNIIAEGFRFIYLAFRFS